MAGDWIKMRAGLMQSPKLIALSRHLHRSNEFREWLTPGGSGSMAGQIVSDDALRCVTCALLLRIWSSSREYGKFDGDHLVLPHLTIPDLDLMAGCPGVGKAMLTVGWAEVKDGDHGGVILPNFRQHNAPMTPAEKQSAYRVRQKSTDDTNDVERYGALPAIGNKAVTREEKRREEYKDPPNPPRGDGVRFVRFWECYPRKTAKQAAEKAFAKLNPSDSLLEEILKALVSQCGWEQWRKDNGAYIPHPATWINQRRWEDQLPQTPKEPSKPQKSAVIYDVLPGVNR